MSRAKNAVFICVAFILLVSGAAMFIKDISRHSRKSVGTWLNTPFDPAGAKTRLSHNLVKDRLTKIHSAMVCYATHNNSRLPPMDSIGQVEIALIPCSSDASVLLSPVTHHLFQPNGRLSNHKLRDFAHPSQIVAFYDVHPLEPGYDRNQPLSYPDVDVLFLDGRISTVSSSDWSKYRAASKIP